MRQSRKGLAEGVKSNALGHHFSGDSCSSDAHNSIREDDSVSEGAIDHHRVPLLWGIFIAAAFTSVAVAKADDERRAWFKNLTQPATGKSCCDFADCHRTEADWRDGIWWAIVAGKWMPVPPEKVLDTKSIDGDAYVCSGPARWILCFVKPSMSM
jgi:hypothetical protein